VIFFVILGGGGFIGIFRTCRDNIQSSKGSVMNERFYVYLPATSSSSVRHDANAILPCKLMLQLSREILIDLLQWAILNRVLMLYEAQNGFLGEKIFSKIPVSKLMVRI